MKPGYYMSEFGNLQIWYPKNTFMQGLQTMDAYQTHRGEFIRIHYTLEDIKMITAVLEFEFLGNL